SAAGTALILDGESLRAGCRRERREQRSGSDECTGHLAESHGGLCGLLVTDSSSTIWLHGGDALFYLQSQPFHQPTPLLLFAVDIGSIGLGCAGQCFGAFRFEPALHVFGRERRIEFLVKPRDDRRWRAGRRNQPVAQRNVKTG